MSSIPAKIKGNFIYEDCHFSLLNHKRLVFILNDTLPLIRRKCLKLLKKVVKKAIK